MEISDTIKINTSSVKPSFRDIEKNIRLPSQYSEDLAYFCGILAGDGHIEIDNHGNYEVYCTGNPLDEQELYYSVLLPLIKRLFNLNVRARLFHSTGTFGFRFSSKLIALFLTKILGLPINKKYDQLKIPFWIKKNQNFVKAYIRGLADTDFYLTLKRRYKVLQYYPVISCASKSKGYMEEVALQLELLGIKVSRSFDVTRVDARFKSGIDITHRIQIYGPTELIKWMKIIGFYSPKHLNKFERWVVRNADSNRLKTKEALKEADLLKNVARAGVPQ